ncbi:MAG: TetR/AcrR family transcriptional regulator [Myxococcota bacterium]
MARPRLISDEQILTTMRSCVLEHGAHVSLDVVAEKLGVTSPALLKRFGSRQELMLQALRPPEKPPFVDTFLAGPDARPLREQLTDRFAELWAFFEQIIPAVSALRESGIPHEKLFDRKHQRPMLMIEAIKTWLAKADELGLADVPAPESVATAILGALQARAFFAHVSNVKYSARNTRAYLDDLVDLFCRALAVKGRRPSRREVA